MSLEKSLAILELCKKAHTPIKIDPNNIRQHYLTDKYYLECLMMQYNSFDELSNGLPDPNSNYSLPSYYIPMLIAEVISLHYTRGIDIPKLLPLLETLKSTCKHDVETFPIPPKNSSLTFDSNELIELTLNMFSLCAIFGRTDIYPYLLKSTDTRSHSDKLLSHLIHYYLDPSYPIDPSIRYMEIAKRNFEFLIQAMVAEKEEEVIAALKKYLSNWYRVQHKLHSIRYDSHTPEKLGHYCYIGYWSFEAALVALKKNIDDSSLHQFVYYPKDIVTYFREHPIEQNTDLSQRQISLWGGELATVTGYWICPNMLESDTRRLQFFSVGQVLPAGYSAKGKFLWEFTGKTEQ